MRKKCVRGCKELYNYLKSKGIRNLGGADEDCFYYRLENGVWNHIPSYRFNRDKFEVVGLCEYLKPSDNKMSEIKEESKEESNSKLKDVLNVQIGGSHYKDSAIQPIEYIMANNLSFPEGCIVKYISRHRRKNGKEDLLKIIQNTQMILADEYGVIIEFKIKE